MSLSIKLKNRLKHISEFKAFSRITHDNITLDCLNKDNYQYIAIINRQVTDFDIFRSPEIDDVENVVDASEYLSDVDTFFKKSNMMYNVYNDLYVGFNDDDSYEDDASYVIYDVKHQQFIVSHNDLDESLINEMLDQLEVIYEAVQLINEQVVNCQVDIEKLDSQFDHLSISFSEYQQSLSIEPSDFDYILDSCVVTQENFVYSDHSFNLNTTKLYKELIEYYRD